MYTRLRGAAEQQDSRATSSQLPGRKTTREYPYVPELPFGQAGEHRPRPVPGGDVGEMKSQDAGERPQRRGRHAVRCDGPDRARSAIRMADELESVLALHVGRPKEWPSRSFAPT